MWFLIPSFPSAVGAHVGKVGHDLVSLNIQRGRDHGLPKYVAIREHLKLPPITSFADITPDKDVQERLYEAYGSVENIDAWVGGLGKITLTVSFSFLGVSSI